MKRLTTLVALLALVFSLGATTVTVGGTDGTTDIFPLATYRSYNYTQQIYKQHQINHAGEITKIRFYHNYGPYTGNLNNSHHWTIYMGLTERDSFASTSDWVPISQLTQVFSGSVLSYFPIYGGWMEIVLQTPFDYDNSDNLLVAVHEDSPYSSQTVTWGSFFGGQGAALSYYSNRDSFNPYPSILPEACLMASDVATIQLVFAATGAPLAPYLSRPRDGAQVMNGYYLEWMLPQNSESATGYDVYIDGSIVSSNQAATRYKLSGLEAGTHTWYVVARNQFGVSPPSNTRSFEIFPAVEIGNGSADNGLPIRPSSHYSYSQSIYLKSEIDNINHQSGEMGYNIDKIAYYWGGGRVGNNSRDWVIYMGHTNRANFATNMSWIPTGQMVQVFSGRVSIPDYPGWVEINLQTPFLYNNSDNLVIAVDENGQGCDPEGFHFHSKNCSDPRRSIHVYSGSDYNIDPNSPPVGVLKAAYPNILIQTGELLTVPIVCVSSAALDFDLVVNGQSITLDLTVSNTGIGSLNLAPSDISIIGSNADQFSFDPVNLPASLGHGESVVIPVTVTGVTLGPISATLRIAYEGENYDVELTAEILDSNNITIGDGTLGQRRPFGTNSRHERSAVLYTADQINATGGIEMIAWDCNHASDVAVPYKIWAKNTHANTMDYSSWQDVTSDMILLKEGILTFENVGWHTFELDQPFTYTGANLIIGVESNFGGYMGPGGQEFRYTDTGMHRHHYWASDDGYPTGPGVFDRRVPNIMLRFAPNAIENDICVVSIDGNLTPIVGEVSHYMVGIRNNGSNVQTNYQIKLMGPNDAVLAVVNGPAINSGSFTELAIPWVPATVGQFDIYAKVEMAGDELEQNNRTNTILLKTQPEGLQAVAIGTGDELDRYPIDFRSNDFIYETLYLADELGFNSGTINAVVFYNKFFGDKPNEAIKVFLGSTDQEDLSTGIISASELALVFDGFIDYPDGENTIVINLQTPYTHTGGNLVLMCFRPWVDRPNGYLHFFKCQTVGNNRARYISNYSYPLDPYSLPEGTLTGTFPQTTFLYTADLVENDLGVWNLRGERKTVIGTTLNYTVRIRNNGISDQANYQVKLLGPGNVELATVAGPPISSMQSLDVNIPWMPTEVGPITIHAKVELVNDAHDTNNNTDEHELIVYHHGVSEVTAALNDAGEVVEITWSDQAPSYNLGAADGSATDRNPPVLTGYMVYRLFRHQEEDETRWATLTAETIPDLSFSDQIWPALPSGDYRWAVKAIYADGMTSLPSFSNAIYREIPSGVLKIFVRTVNYEPIAGASISNGVIVATTDDEGYCYYRLPMGTYTLEASAPGFISQTLENVEVVYQPTTLNFYLEQGTPTDDPQIPVVATALNGNYPNPFNPETTISYRIKEPGRVRLQVYNIRGQLVRTLVDEDHATGHYEKLFDGKDNGGRSLASGVYLIRMSAPGYQKASKMMLMK